MGAILQIIGALLAFIGSLYLDYKARIAAQEMSARRAASKALSAAVQAEADAARCASRQAEMRRLADQARKLGQDATNLEQQIKGLSMSASKFKTDADNLRLWGDRLSREALQKPPGFLRSLMQFKFSARSLGSKILGAISFIMSIAAILTILENEIDKLQKQIADYEKAMPCNSSGPSNLSLEEIGLLELLELID